MPEHSSSPATPRRPAFLAGLLLACAAAVCGGAWAQADPPGRIGRLNANDGAVSTAPLDGSSDWTALAPNRPLTGGDRLWTDRGARADVQVGATSLRLDGETSVDLVQLDDQTTQLRLNQGRLQLRVRSLAPGERLEIDTPNLAFVASQPGSYRIEADPALGTTRVVSFSGGGTLYGEGGEAVPLGAPQQITTIGRRLAPAPATGNQQPDGFDQWIAQRDRLEDQSVTAQYVPRDLVGYQPLDQYGDWQADATYGAVWYPRTVAADWAPYRYGHWQFIAPWGWTWVDDAPWGFAPFHYGRWAQVGPRWGWVPGPRQPRPVYAPALVGFIGSGPGRPGMAQAPVAWVPLAPGEAWRPGAHVNAGYVGRVNRAIGAARVAAAPVYTYQHQPGAVSALAPADFERGRPVRGEGYRFGGDELRRTQAVPLPGAPNPPSGQPRTAFTGREHRAAPPMPSTQPTQPMQPMQQPPVPIGQAGPGPQFQPPGGVRVPPADPGRAQREAFEASQRQQQQQQQLQAQQAQRDQQRHEQAQRERNQRDQAAREQVQREQMARQQQEQQERALQQQQRDQAQRIQRAQQEQMEHMQRQQQSQLQRMQQPPQQPQQPQMQQPAVPIGRPAGGPESPRHGPGGWQRNDGAAPIR